MSRNVTPYTTCGTAADDSTVGTQTWASPNTIAGNYNSISTATTCTGVVNTTKTTHYLKCTNFGFKLPADAVIQGIQVRIGKYKGTTGPTVKDANVKLVTNGSIAASTDKADTVTAYALQSGGAPQYQGTQPYGGLGDLWGLTLVASDINNSGFGAAIACTLTSTSDATAVVDIQTCQIIVYYDSQRLGKGRTEERYKPAPFKPGDGTFISNLRGRKIIRS